MSDPETILQDLRAGNLDQTIKEWIVDRTLPLPKEYYWEALFYLLSEPFFRGTAEGILGSLPQEDLEAYFSGSRLSPALSLFLYDRYKAVLGRNALKSLVANPTVSSKLLVQIARSQDSELVELVSLNEVMLLAFPEILETLISSTVLPRERAFALQEMKRRFIDGERDEEEETPEEKRSTEEEGEETAEKITVEVETEEGVERKELSLHEIKSMRVGDRVKLALFGNKEIRTILITDANRLVREAVLQSPKLMDIEIEFFARQKSLPDDVVRRISQNRSWSTKPAVLLALLKNPKCPVGFSMTALDRLSVRELRALEKNKDVPELVRRKARALLAARNS